MRASLVTPSLDRPRGRVARSRGETTEGGELKRLTVLLLLAVCTCFAVTAASGAATAAGAKGKFKFEPTTARHATAAAPGASRTS
jgi:hypothetical protein